MAVKRRNGFICKWKLVRMHDTTNAFFWYSWRTCPSDGRNTRTTLLTDFTVSFTSRLHPHQSINLCEWIRSEWYKPSMTQEVSQIQSLPPMTIRRIIDRSKIQLSDFYWGALAFHMADPSGSSTAKRVIQRWREETGRLKFFELFARPNQQKLNPSRWSFTKKEVNNAIGRLAQLSV